MAVFTIATIGNTKDNAYFEIAQQLLEQKFPLSDDETKNQVQFIDITGMTQDDIDELGTITGVMYFKDIHSDPSKTETFKALLRSHTVPSDLSLFPLSHEPVTTKEQEEEQKKVDSYIKEDFEHVKNDKELKVSAVLTNITTAQEMIAYTNGIVTSSLMPYFNFVGPIEKQTTEKINGILKSIDEALEFKHPYTEGHVQRVSTFAEAIAREMNCSEKEVQDITIASALHDIGKLIIPDKILGSSKQLSYAERQQMEIHDKAGAQFLEAIVAHDEELAKKLNPEVLRAIKNHHKDWDGKHDRNQKDCKIDPINHQKIGKYGTIIAVADCIDAMVSQRAYNNPKHILDTFRDLWSNREKQFEPEAAESAILLLGQEIASLGYDPVKMFSEVSDNPWRAQIDKGLQKFFEGNAHKFEVNKNPEPGAYNRLGFRLNENGYFEFEGKNAAPLSHEIRFNDEMGFLRTHKDKVPGGLNLSPEDFEKAARAQATQKFINQDAEGKKAIGRAAVFEIKRSISDKITEPMQNPTERDIPSEVNELSIQDNIKTSDCKSAIEQTKALKEKENQLEAGIVENTVTTADR